MTVRTPPTFLQSEAHPAENVRLMTAGMFGSSSDAFTGGFLAVDPGHGVGRVGDLNVVQNSTPDMSVNVTAGGCFIRGTSSNAQGVYHFYNDGTVNLTVGTSDPTNPRNDLVVAQVRDSSYAGSDDDARLFVVQGTAAAVPVDPAIPENCLVLARLSVGANATSVVTANILNAQTRARPWNVAWGHVAGMTPANFTFTTSTGDSATLFFQQIAGRRYRVTVSAEYQSASANPTVATVSVRTSTNSVVNAGVLRWTSRNSGDQNRSSGVFTYNPPSTGFVTWKVSAVLSLAAGTATIAAPMLLIEDMGPA